MNAPEPWDVERLAGGLKREARQASPAFSPLLHERIMQRVRSARPGVRESRRSPWRSAWPGAAVAALLLIGLGAWMWSRPPVAPPEPVAKRLPVVDVAESIQRVAADTKQELNATLMQSQLATLDHDARRFAGFVKDSVTPFPPRP